MDSNVSDYIAAEEEPLAKGGHAVAVYSPDGERRVIFGGSRVDCEAIATGVRETLAAWPGWTD